MLFCALFLLTWWERGGTQPAAYGMAAEFELSSLCHDPPSPQYHPTMFHEQSPKAPIGWLMQAETITLWNAFSFLELWHQFVCVILEVAESKSIRWMNFVVPLQPHLGRTTTQQSMRQTVEWGEVRRNSHQYLLSTSSKFMQLRQFTSHSWCLQRKKKNNQQIHLRSSAQGLSSPVNHVLCQLTSTVGRTNVVSSVPGINIDMLQWPVYVN